MWLGFGQQSLRPLCLFLPPPCSLSSFQSHLPWWLPAIFKVAAPQDGRSLDASFTAWRRDSQESCLACTGPWCGREINLYHMKPWKFGDYLLHWLALVILTTVEGQGTEIGESRYSFSLTSDSTTGLTWHYFPDIRTCHTCTGDWAHSSWFAVGWCREGACPKFEQQRSRI